MAVLAWKGHGNHILPTGRPSLLDDEVLVNEILDRLADGEGLWKICQDPRMPSRGTILRWAADDSQGFRDKYARAMNIGMDSQVDDAERIARDGSNDWMETEDGAVLNHEHIQRSRLIVDTIKWKASKIAPKKYGDRIAQEVSGPDGGAIKSEHVIVFVNPATSE